MMSYRGWRLAVTMSVLTIFVTGMVPASAQAPATNPAAQQPAAGSIQAPLALPPLPSNAPPPQRFGDWAKRCSVQPGNKVQHCHLTQVLMHTKNQKRQGLLMLRVGYYGEKKIPAVIMRVPLALGVYLPTGLTLTVPGAEPLRVVIESCLPKQGCRAVAKLPSAMVSAMKNANKGTVALRTLRRQQLKLPVSFKGITAGLASLNKS